MDDSYGGLLTFDLDSLWIRNMAGLMSQLATGMSGYDFISMGTTMENMYAGRLVSNFGAGSIMRISHRNLNLDFSQICLIVNYNSWAYAISHAATVQRMMEKVEIDPQPCYHCLLL